MRRTLGIVLVGLGGLVALLGLLWFGYGYYVEHVVAGAPSTTPVLRTDRGVQRLGQYRSGDQVVDDAPPEALPSPMAAPTAPLAIPADSPATPSLAATVLPSPTRSAPPAADRPPILPPVRLQIPKIGVDLPVVLADGTDLPRFKGIGWYLGTGYPGFHGNAVFFGHLNGVYETFGRLHELEPGDGVQIQVADGRAYRYQVTAKSTVPEADVSVLAPTKDSRLTLLTCTGTFFPISRDYSDRLVVTARLVDGPAPDSP